MSFDLENFLPYRLYQAAEQTSQAFYHYYRETYGLGRTEWRVLFNVGQYGPLSAVEISKRSNLEKTKISRAVQRLYERGWLRRIYLESDRRRHQLELTKDGLKVSRELSKMAASFNQQIEDIIGRERAQQLICELQKLEESVSETPLS
jgi:DNA-binding MarR family transcriptional regulator